MLTKIEKLRQEIEILKDKSTYLKVRLKETENNLSTREADLKFLYKQQNLKRGYVE